MREKEIAELMQKLGISHDEATELWMFDHDEVENKEVEELTEKAKSVKRYEKSDAPRKKSVKPRKVDEIKVEIILTLAQNLTRMVLNDEDLSMIKDIVVVKPEREIAFTLKGESYSVVLTKHRPPKK
jgi:hypothetical protein